LRKYGHVLVPTPNTWNERTPGAEARIIPRSAGYGGAFCNVGRASLPAVSPSKDGVQGKKTGPRPLPERPLSSRSQAPAWECLSSGLCPVFGPEAKWTFIVRCDREVMAVYLNVLFGLSYSNLLEIRVDITRLKIADFHVLL